MSQVILGVHPLPFPCICHWTHDAAGNLCSFIVLGFLFFYFVVYFVFCAASFCNKDWLVVRPCKRLLPMPYLEMWIQKGDACTLFSHALGLLGFLLTISRVKADKHKATLNTHVTATNANIQGTRPTQKVVVGQNVCRIPISENAVLNIRVL